MAQANRSKILIIDDNQEYRNILQLHLYGHDLQFAESFVEAKSKLAEAHNANQPFDFVTVDRNFKLENSETSSMFAQQGETIIKFIKKEYPNTGCILITGDDLAPDYVLDLRDRYDLDYCIRKPDVNEVTIEKAIKRIHERHHLQQQSEADTIPLSRVTSKQGVFLSYSRKVSWAHARAIANSLTSRGIDVFLDFDGIERGDFTQKIRSELNSRSNFLVVLGNGTLESEWVNYELSLALMTGNKNIVPVLIDDFKLPENLPLQINELANLQCHVINPGFYEPSIENIVNALV